MSLTGKQKRYLRGLGHHLKPMVHVGQNGVTAGLVHKVDQELKNHELIKVKLGGGADGTTDQLVEALAPLGAEHVQSVGRVVLVYRARDKDPEIELP